MAVEYRLIIAGEHPVTEVATRAYPEAGDRFQPYRQGLELDLRADLGLAVNVWPGQDGYFDAETDDGVHWEWQPASYVDITCRMAKDPELLDVGTHTMLDIVARVLATGSEDAALTLDGNYLLLSRVKGVTTKHRRSWWDHYGWPNQIIPG